MSEILFINACISTGHPSRTLFLARYFLKQLAKNTQSKITEIDLTKENLQPLNEKTLAARTADLDSKQLLKPKFHSDCMSQMFSAAQRTSIYFEYIHFLP